MGSNTLKAAVAAIAVLTGGGALMSADEAQAQSRGYGGYDQRGYDGGTQERLYQAEMRVVQANFNRNMSRCNLFERGCQAGARSVQAREAFEVNARYGRATQAEVENAYSLRLRAIDLQRQDRMAECWQSRNYNAMANCQLQVERRTASDSRSAQSWYRSATRRVSR